MAHDTLAALASDMCDAIQIASGHEAFARWLAQSEQGAEAVRIVDVRAARIGATAADVDRRAAS